LRAKFQPLQFEIVFLAAYFESRLFLRYIDPNSRCKRGEAMGEKGIILRLVAITLAFVGVMGALGYFVTRYPELLTSDSLAVVGGVAVSVPDSRSTGIAQTYRCRMAKDYVIEANSSRVATTLQTTSCGYEDSASPN